MHRPRHQARHRRKDHHANTATTWPRSQHWHAEGFRITVLVYKSHRSETCTCRRRGAIHAVWTNQRADGFSGGPADFCDEHRPAKGTLPDLEYERITSDRADFGSPDWDSRDWTTTYERLTPDPACPCTTCGRPSAIRRVLNCGRCQDPDHWRASDIRLL